MARGPTPITRGCNRLHPCDAGGRLSAPDTAHEIPMKNDEWEITA